MITVFDSETTGIPQFGKPLSDPVQPRVMQLAAIQYDGDRRVLNRFTALFQRGGWVSGARAKEVHGISEVRCDRYGIRSDVALAFFMDMVRTSKAIASFGTRFDKTMMEIEFHHQGGLPSGWALKREIDIMEAAAQAVNGGKAMKLVAAHLAIVGEEFEQRHDAEEDALAASRILYALVDQGRVTL